MAINDLSPAYVKLYYTNNTTTHIQVLPTKPSGALVPGLEPSVLGYDGNAIPLDTAATAYVNVIRPLFASTTSWLFAEFWSKPNPTDDPIFIFQAELGIAGSNVGAANAFTQNSLTFRTQFGGLYRNILLESVIAPNVRDDFPFSNATLTAIRNYLLGATSWVYGRDGGKLIAAIRSLSKTNDELRRRGLLNIS